MNGQEDKEKEILVTRSSLPSYEEYIEMIKPIWDSAWLTNMGDFHKQLEKELKEYMGIRNMVLFVNGHMACLLYTSCGQVSGPGEAVNSDRKPVFTGNRQHQRGL